MGTKIVTPYFSMVLGEVQSGYAEEGASISINRLPPTPSSVRCAPASGRG